MSLSYSQIIERLEEIEADLGERQNEYEAAADDVRRLAREFQLREAHAFMAAKGDTATERKAKATIALAAAEDGIWERMGAAEGRYEGLRAAVRVLEQRGTIGMSLLKAQTREAGPQPQWSRKAA